MRGGSGYVKLQITPNPRHLRKKDKATLKLIKLIDPLHIHKYRRTQSKKDARLKKCLQLKLCLRNFLGPKDFAGKFFFMKFHSLIANISL